MASFFSSQRIQCIRDKRYWARDAARADQFDDIARFDNTIRKHSTIGYHSPAEFEKKVGLAELTVHRTGSRPVELLLGAAPGTPAGAPSLV